MENTNAVFAIVMVTLTPICTLCILFNFVVVICCRNHSIDLAACTLLVARLGHACAVVILMATYTLESWDWSRSMCQTFVWLWMTCWVLDVLTNLFFLAYHAATVGQASVDVRCHMFLLLLASWGLAILAGSLTFLTDSLFHNYNEARRACVLGLSISDNPILIGTMLLIIIGILLIVVLTISVSAESRTVALKYKLIQVRAERLRTSKIPNGDSGYEREMATHDSTSHQDMQRLNANSNANNNIDHTSDVNTEPSTHSVYTRAYVDKKMRDIRHIHAAATATTILLNMAPQLVLYSIDILSGSSFAYTHHILVTAGIVHCFVLPVTFCTAGIRYKATSKHLVKGIFGRSARTAHSNVDPEQKVVFHIRDVTTDSSDTNALDSASNDVTYDDTHYKRGQLQVLSMRGEPSLAPSSVERQKSTGSDVRREENGVVVVEATACTHSKPESREEAGVGATLGSVNPGFVNDEVDCNYVRSLSDGSVDYRQDSESDDDWLSWDSDSETWSNLYDYSDIEEVLDGKLYPDAGTFQGRRASRVSQSGSRGRRRKLSTQTSWPPVGQSPRSRERRRSGDRKRKRKSKRKGRREKKGLELGLESTMNIGIASTMISRDPKEAFQGGHSIGGESRTNSGNTDNYVKEYTRDSTANQDTSHTDTTSSPPPAPDMDALLRKDKSRDPEMPDVSVEKEGRVQSMFASELAAAALKLRHIPSTNRQRPHSCQPIGAIGSQMNIIRKESSVRSTQNTRGFLLSAAQPSTPIRKISARRESSSRRVIRENSNSGLPQSEIKLSRRSNSSAKGSVPARKQSSVKSRSSAPPSGVAQNLDAVIDSSRPISSPEIEPALANITLGKIMNDPVLRNLLKRSLESLESVTDDEREKVSHGSPGGAGIKSDMRGKQSSSSSQSDQSQVSECKRRPSEMTFYQIPNIDSDHRYRPRRAPRRGKEAFKAAAQTVIIQEFLKKATKKPPPAPKPNLGSTGSKLSWSNDDDAVHV